MRDLDRRPRGLKLVKHELQRILGTALLQYVLGFRNRLSHDAILGDGPVVSLTTHGDRYNRVHLTIESIGRGKLKPKRIVLWVNEESLVVDAGHHLQRLVKRGLEIRFSENFGPHTKYFPILSELNGSALVTADDDILYARYWLKSLDDLGRSSVGQIVCFRAHELRIRDGELRPYAEWTSCRTTVPGLKNVMTGVSGVYYPPEFLLFVEKQGTEFTRISPRNDDIWLHSLSVRSGTLVRQVADRPIHFPVLLGSQRDGLMHSNVGASANDSQARAAYAGLRPEDFGDFGGVALAP